MEHTSPVVKRTTIKTKPRCMKCNRTMMSSKHKLCSSCHRAKKRRKQRMNPGPSPRQIAQAKKENPDMFTPTSRTVSSKSAPTKSYEFLKLSLASSASAVSVIRPKLNQGWEIIFSTTSFCYMRRAKP